MTKIPQIDVSVLVPVFNVEAGLDSCYNEIVVALGASPYSFEIIFQNDITLCFI
jgi:glycosyltransferase involved in cell wall biosynthesis